MATKGNPDVLRILSNIRFHHTSHMKRYLASRLEKETDERCRSTLETILEYATYIEDRIAHELEAEASLFPIYSHMLKVWGVGKLRAAQIIGYIGSIKNFTTVSKLWRYAGYAVFDGERERPVKGRPMRYNKRLKTVCYLLATALASLKSPYRKVYEEARAYYTANRPQWTEGRRHLAALRKVTKLFLTHLWVRWRQIEGLPVAPPYSPYGKPKTFTHPPEAFGWPPLDDAEGTATGVEEATEGRTAKRGRRAVRDGGVDTEDGVVYSAR